MTLDRDNLVWLRGRVAAGASGSLSELVDQLVSEARASGAGVEHGMRSVVGTIDVADADPDLLEADAYLRSLFGQSVRRPLLVKEEAPTRRRKRG